MINTNPHNHPIILRFREEYPMLLPTIVTTIRRAYEEVRHMLTPDRLNDLFWREAFPQMLFASMQKQFAEVFSEDTLPGVTVKRMPNAIANCHHAELMLPGIILTVNALSGNETRPRNAVYREQLAGQTSLFDDRLLSDAESKLYLCIVHKRDARKNEPKEIKLVSMCRLGTMGTLNHSIIDEVTPEEAFAPKKVAAFVEPEVISAGSGPRLK